MKNLELIDWNKSGGLIPAIVQNAQTGQVLMQGYMNAAALEQTLKTKKVTFYSRKRDALWVKGETSGNYLQLLEIKLDCDQDSVLVLAKPSGPTCHQGTVSCFGAEIGSWQVLLEVERVIAERERTQAEKSYTVNLLKQGAPKIAQKVGEEAVETIIAALSESDERLCNESADLLYHLLVLLRSRKLKLENIFKVLSARF